MKIINFFLINFLLLNFSVSGKNKVEPVQFKANRVEYIYKKGAEQTICRGNARIWRSDFILNANTIKLYGKDNNIAKAYKNITLISKTNDIIITGDYGEYNNIKSYAKVFKNPVLTVTNRNLVIKSSVMETYIKENKSIAFGDVIITQTNYRAYGEKGVYYQDKGIVELTGSPIVYYNDNIFSAEKIIVYIQKKRVKLYGEVKADIVAERK